jgi:hypothetical protein
MPVSTSAQTGLDSFVQPFTLREVSVHCCIANRPAGAVSAGGGVVSSTGGLSSFGAVATGSAVFSGGTVTVGVTVAVGVAPVDVVSCVELHAESEPMKAARTTKEAFFMANM